MTRSLAAFTAAALLVSCGVASAEPLKLKPGHWGVSTVVQRGEPKLPANIDQLTPDQRAKVIEKLSQPLRKRLDTQSCVTPEQVASGEALLGGGSHHGCARTVTESTSSRWAAALECAGAGAASGTMQLESNDPAHVSGSIVIKAKGASQQIVTQSWLTAVWLSADCPVTRAPAKAKGHR